MAEPIDYAPRPARTEPTAHDEWERLLHTLHEHGVLRLANDLVARNQDIARIVLRGFEAESTRNALQNVAAVAMVLSRVPPGAVYKFADALREAATAWEPGAGEAGAAPGIRGVYRLLNDDDAWRTLTPLVRAIGRFGRAMARPAPEKPITAHTGKASDA
ncbi:DUF1641 domain-containing protein [Luteibacter sp. 3190]|uniref:DUF1641 domain-containing protein n=1 Tax=Luteibacter sp. 3190 TaxID=2817736 RepID=UPI002861828F|nr:DUF1641 domain-containing protein [Luteibacter sp. 3190]MDR6936486.1 uncharacterized protein YjgD (DUF1641 family) [Luteibacter sp. 3190]